MIPEAECLRIIFEILKELRFEDFKIKVSEIKFNSNEYFWTYEH